MKKSLSSTQRAWLSVLGAFLVSSGSGLGGALSLFYLPIGADLGFSQASISVFVSIMSLCGIVSQPVVGRIMSRHSRRLRLIAFCGAAVGLICYLWLSICRELYQFYIGGVIMGFLLPVVGALYGATVATHWFAKKRSVAIAIVAVGSSAGTVIYSQLARFFIEHSGWRSAYLAMGVAIAIITVIGALLISPPPEFLGMKPYGWEEMSTGETQLKGFTLQQALKSSSFWLFAVATFFGSAYVMGIQQSIMPMLQVDFKLTAGLAATMMSVYSIVCGGAKPIMGIIFEKYGVKRTIVLMGILICSALLVLVLASGSVAAMIAMIVFGVGNMFGTVIMASYVAEAYGNRANSAILGYMNIAFSIGVSVGPVMVGRIYDVTSSYKPGYYIFIAFCILSTILTLMSANRVKKDREKLNIA